MGTEVNLENSRSHIFAHTGVRFDDSAVPVAFAGVADPTTIYYREHYVRYSLLKRISGPWSMEASGFHRYRYEPAARSVPWREGENYLSAIYSPKVTVAFGFEYSTKEDKNYYNGLVQYRFTTDSLMRLFVGQTRPALRCVSGVCRQFPAFEGVKLEAIVAF